MGRHPGHMGRYSYPLVSPSKSSFRPSTPGVAALWRLRAGAAFAEEQESVATAGTGGFGAPSPASPATRERPGPAPGSRRNLELVEAVQALAAEKGCTPAQLALAWLLAQGEDIVPIPGTKRVRRLEENVGTLDVHLSPEDLARLEAVFPRGAAAGERYPAQAMASLNR
jgi:hypothetical protein